MDPEFREQLTRIEDKIEEYLEKVLEIIIHMRVERDWDEVDALEECTQDTLKDLRKARGESIQ